MLCLLNSKLILLIEFVSRIRESLIKKLWAEWLFPSLLYDTLNIFPTWWKWKINWKVCSFSSWMDDNHFHFSPLSKERNLKYIEGGTQFRWILTMETLWIQHLFYFCSLNSLSILSLLFFCFIRDLGILWRLILLFPTPTLFSLLAFNHHKSDQYCFFIQISMLTLALFDRNRLIL